VTPGLISDHLGLRDLLNTNRPLESWLADAVAANVALKRRTQRIPPRRFVFDPFLAGLRRDLNLAEAGLAHLRAVSRDDR